MVPLLDDAHAPLTTRYIESLPDGLQSHPQAQVRSDVLHTVRAALSDVDTMMPEPMRVALRDQSDERWHPEVVGVALMLMCRDWVFQSDEAFLEWAFEASLKLFETPLNRMLMMVVSPTLVSIGAGKKWGNFHRGSELVSGGVNKEGSLHVVSGHMSFPEHLFPELIVARWSRSILAALSTTRAQDPKIETTAYTSTIAHFRVTWS
ncbi:MAG: hypothetical protein AAFQ82_16950 [Myxococcota bacterium]